MTDAAPEPDFVAQTGEPMTPEERSRWFQDRIREMRGKGATWCQASIDDRFDPVIALAEGWKLPPKHKPKPHFLMTIKEPKL